MKGSPRERGRIDWDAVRLLLEQAREALARVLDPPPEKLAQVYRLRAERLARPDGGDAGAGAVPVLVFRLDEDRYGIELARLAGVAARPRCSPVPGAPPELLGVMQVRGEIRPLYDSRRLLGRSAAGTREPGAALLLARGRHAAALAIDEAEDIRGISPAERRALPGQPGYVRYVTPDSVAVLEPDELLRQALP